MMGCCLFVYYRKKRKQTSRDADSLSLCSLDINLCVLDFPSDIMVVGKNSYCIMVQQFESGCSVESVSNNSTMVKQVEEPSTKRSKLVSRVTSLANLLPPVKTVPLKRIGQTLQRSISFRNETQTERSTSNPPPSSVLKSRTVPATVSTSNSTAPTRVSTTSSQTSKRRDSKLWSETFDVHLGATQPLSPREIKRQEAIFELAQGEQDLVEDLKLAKKAYHDPMLKLSIMTEQELTQIFGTLDSLIPLHEDLLSHLHDARKPDGSTEHVGHILADWLPCLSSYTPYCSNQVKAKALLDQKKQDRRVQDFLQRCIQSPFSRKLDLWNFLDIPRSRLVKYPLLLREILKHTPNDHPDRQHLDEAMLMVQSVVADINKRTGESECQYYKDRLIYSEYAHRDELINRSKTLSCHGELKNNRGLKLHVFLFQDVLVITRSVSLNEHPVSYQLCRQPIPIRLLDLEDLSDGEMRVGGSIRGAFSNNERTKNFFRVSFRSGAQLQTHCFQASDAFNKQQWINCIRQAKEAAALSGGALPQTGAPGGEMDRLGEADLRLGGDPALEDEKGSWGEMEAGLRLEGEEGVRLDEEGGVDLTEGSEREMEAGAAADGDLEEDGDAGRRSAETDGGADMEVGHAAGGETAGDDLNVAEGSREGEEAGGEVEVSSDGVNDVSSISMPPDQEEKEVMEEEQSGAEAEEEVGMDTSDVDPLQSEELIFRC